jgi:hypothetical protein
MFIGVQNNIPCFIKATKQELENLPCVSLDEIREVEFAEMYNGKIYLDADELILAKKDFVRSLRNSYLEKYLDPIISNPLRWADMPDSEKQVYIDYRQYLLNYTAQENWYNTTPKTLTEWRD